MLHDVAGRPLVVTDGTQDELWAEVVLQPNSLVLPVESHRPALAIRWRASITPTHASRSALAVTAASEPDAA